MGDVGLKKSEVKDLYKSYDFEKSPFNRPLKRFEGNFQTPSTSREQAFFKGIRQRISHDVILSGVSSGGKALEFSLKKARNENKEVLNLFINQVEKEREYSTSLKNLYDYNLTEKSKAMVKKHVGYVYTGDDIMYSLLKEKADEKMLSIYPIKDRLSRDYYDKPDLLRNECDFMDSLSVIMEKGDLSKPDKNKVKNFLNERQSQTLKVRDVINDKKGVHFDDLHACHESLIDDISLKQDVPRDSKTAPLKPVYYFDNEFEKYENRYKKFLDTATELSDKKYQGIMKYKSDPSSFDYSLQDEEPYMSPDFDVSDLKGSGERSLDLSLK